MVVFSSNCVVIKVGSSTLTYQTGMLNLRKLEELVKCIADLKNSGKQVILVSSGAVAAGFAKMEFPTHKIKTEEKQAAAAVGQCELMAMYSSLFANYGHKVAQILITKDVVDNELRCTNATNTFRVLLDMGCIPIVNENDSISSEGIDFGGNDTLAAVVALLCKADLLINISDIDGLYTDDPRRNPDAKLIEHVTEITPELEQMAGGAGTGRGTGGMKAKLEAAKMVTDAGIPMVIINGANIRVLYDIFETGYTGTIFEPKKIK
ncbi:MAG: glutamate 5-kinase [Clostridiales bacterium GWF2_38_85]|nr:MAG: glutamate 5-kinase [Clostridiales bacterium GWF2_38_85]HBL84739.1 glutamate 5-kinase [Clostridiales bacterium]